MTTLTATPATAGLILALDLGKYNTVACACGGYRGLIAPLDLR